MVRFKGAKLVTDSALEQNSFYDVISIDMSPAKLAKYKRLSGISSKSHYEEILKELEAEDSASESNS